MKLGRLVYMVFAKMMVDLRRVVPTHTCKLGIYQPDTPEGVDCGEVGYRPMTMLTYITADATALQMIRTSSIPTHLTKRNLVKILSPTLTIVMQKNAVETATSCGPLLSVDDILE